MTVLSKRLAAPTAWIALAGAISAGAAPQSPSAVAVAEGGLFRGRDLTYQGAFLLPNIPKLTYIAEWGGIEAYRPDGDPNGPADGYPGSLFGIGHAQTSPVFEIAIPAPLNSRVLGDLPVAPLLQQPVDIRTGDYRYIRALGYLGPQANTGAHVYLAHGEHFEYTRRPAHGWMDPDGFGNRVGSWYVGQQGVVPHINTNDYIFTIPKAWADRHTPGMYLACGRYRRGQMSGGPTVIAYGPYLSGNPPAPQTALDAVPLVLYETVDQGHNLIGHCKADFWGGGAWLRSDTKQAVIIVGMKGYGECWYGWADGTTPADCAQLPGGCDANGYPHSRRGYHAESYKNEILFYDPDELAAVAAGALPSWAPQPYERYDISSYMLKSDVRIFIAGIAYDPEHGLLYVTERRGGGDTARPAVHVWKLDPAPPENANIANKASNGNVGNLGNGGAQASPEGTSARLAVSPNPIRGSARVSIKGPALATSDRVMTRVALYDVTGTLVKDFGPVGRAAVDIQAGEVPSGTYFLRATAAGKVYTQKVCLVR